MYTKIIVFLLAGTNCELERITFPFNNDKYIFCGDMADEIRPKIATYYEYIEGERDYQGWYTKDGKLFVGVRCE